MITQQSTVGYLLVYLNVSTIIPNNIINAVSHYSFCPSNSSFLLYTILYRCPAKTFFLAVPLYQQQSREHSPLDQQPLPLLPTPTAKPQTTTMMMMMMRGCIWEEEGVGGGFQYRFFSFLALLGKGEGDWREEGTMEAPTSCFVFFLILALLILH